MKQLKTLVATIVMTAFLSCGGGTSKQPATADGFEAIEQELKSKFGDQAYYTDLSITYNASIGNSISLTVTENPASLKMSEYVYSNHTSWKQTSEISLEVPEGTKAADYMFQLSDTINLKKLGELIEVSSIKLTKEKNIDHPALDMAFIKFPKNGDISKAQYVVKLEPESGGTSFTFYHKLNGDLIKMDY